jgi:predicted exporter
LLWLLALLLMILGGTLALGGLMMGTLNVVSTGFAAILLGLAADYGLVLYQEACTRRHPDAAALRRELTPTIGWAALTTAGAFALLNLSSLPGLAQLGSLVAIGVLLAAFVMLAAYLPPLLKQSPAGANTASSPARNWIPNPRLVRIVTLVVFAGMAVVLFAGLPRFDRSPDALRPGRSAAYAALDEIRDELRTGPEPFWLVLRGSDALDVRNRLERVRPVLEHLKAAGEIEDFTLPDSLWPDPRLQEANRDTARVLAGHRKAVRAAFLASGFTTNALVMTGAMLDFWERAAAETPPVWPANPSSQWVLDKFAARAPGALLALGLVYVPADSTGQPHSSAIDALIADLPRDGVWLSGWDHLGSELSGLVLSELPVVLGWIGLLVCGALWLVFRKPREVLLSLATLLLSVGVLMAVMRTAGWSWNMMNLMAVPLLFGLGVDYSIHIQLALRRHHGDLAAVRQSVGRALLLAGGTTITAFGSLAFSSNAGLASLGRVCAVGITATMLIAVYLLPGWWRAWARKEQGAEQAP